MVVSTNPAAFVRGLSHAIIVISNIRPKKCPLFHQNTIDQVGSTMLVASNGLSVAHCARRGTGQLPPQTCCLIFQYQINLFGDQVAKHKHWPTIDSKGYPCQKNCPIVQPGYLSRSERAVSPKIMPRLPHLDRLRHNSPH